MKDYKIEKKAYILSNTSPLPNIKKDFKIKYKPHLKSREFYKRCHIDDFDLDYQVDLFNKGNGFKTCLDFDPEMLIYDSNDSQYSKVIENINNTLGGCEFPDSCITAFNNLIEYEDLYKNSKDVDKSVKNYLHREQRKFIKKKKKLKEKIAKQTTTFNNINKTIIFN
jgi:hypothetical protein